MLSKSMSEASAVSTRTSKSGWGEEDPEVRLLGMHLSVLGGHPVWPLEFHQFVLGRDQRAFVEQYLEGCDFVPVPLEPRSFGLHHLEELLLGFVTNGGRCGCPWRRLTVCWRCWTCCT